MSLLDQRPMMEFEGIRMSYGRQEVLRGADLAVLAGDFLVVFGVPASGKTVLMRILMGLEQPTDGTVRLRGVDVTQLPAAERNIGYVPQSFALYPHINVHDNIAYPLKLAGVARRESEPIVIRAAEMLKIGDLLDKRPNQLSGGQKQRVAIARGIAKQTDIFVLDDPLAGLDFKLREQLVDDLKELQVMSRATFVYTTSDAIETMTLADKLAVLAKGRIMEMGSPERVYDEPARAETMRVFGFPEANFLEGVLLVRDGSVWCEASPFTFPTALAERWAGQRVTIGLRPESINIGGEAGLHRTGLNMPVRILLREDLGGEEIVYLDAAGHKLTTVVRHDVVARDIPDDTTMSVAPRDLVLFTLDGERIGQEATDYV